NIDPADTNPFRYCGEYFDNETQSIYLRARYYSPVTGRFGQQDPAMADGMNWYVYCNGNPLVYADPTGEDAIIITDKDAVYGQGHTSALFQDYDGNWYYYFWGSKEAFVIQVDDPHAMDNLENLNNWLQNNVGYSGNIIYEGSYDTATYIAGDFTKSLRSAIDKSKNFSSDQYNLFTNNCVQSTWDCVLKGSFYDGTPVNSMFFWSDIGIRPNNNIDVFSQLFQNSDFTHDAYWKTINDKLWQARQDLKTAKGLQKQLLEQKIKVLEKLYY
ncbi:RHS repeat-associated core domain-containing protein, partial [Methanobrevibacter smithii]|uniref:RHS repeat-associated core domain-containing protein n=1 Tax=Methanobrevibacter smithii TaxID=2173 RepID=UPI0037DD51EC